MRFDDDMLLIRHTTSHSGPLLSAPVFDPVPPAGWYPASEESLMSLPTTSPAARPVLNRWLVRAAVVVAAITGALATATGSVAAQQPTLVVNALAPQISAEAELAIAAYDQFVESDSLADYLAYAAHRTATARLAAQQLGADEWTMIEAWQATSLDHQRAVLSAMSQVGVPYRRHTSEEGVGFDCSGLTLYAWEQSGVELDRISRDQISAAESLDGDEAKAGDLAYWPGHVMMYLGVDNAVIHARNTGRTVELEAISDRRAAKMRFGDPTGS